MNQLSTNARVRRAAAVAKGDGYDNVARETIRQLWASGLSMTQIGLRIGRTKNAVCGIVHRMHLPPRPSPIAAKSDKPARARKAGKVTLPNLVMSGIANEAAVQRAIDAVTLAEREPVSTVFRPLPDHPCCYVVSAGRPSRYCDEPARAGRSYCDAHHAVCHSGGTSSLARTMLAAGAPA